MQDQKKELETVFEPLTEIVEENGARKQVSYLVQKRPMIVSKAAWEKLQKFKKFGKAANTKIDDKNLTISNQGLEFDGGLNEDNVMQKLTKDKDLARIQALSRNKTDAVESGFNSKTQRKIMDDFDNTTYCIR